MLIRSTTGVAPAPEGVTPDFNDSSGHLKTTGETIAAVALTLSTSCLVMRIYTKMHLLRRFWIDDDGYSHSGYGIHIWNITVSRLGSYERTILAASVIYVPALALAKLALLMLYYTLLRTVTHVWKYIIFVIAFIIISYTIAFVLAIIFACSPLAKSWDPTITTGSCINLHSVYLTIVITNTTSDVIIILIPVPIIRELRLPFLQRLGVICLFGIGGLTIITSIIRIATLIPFLVSDDQTYTIAVPIVLIFIEGNFIIICGCLPYLRHFLRHHPPRRVRGSRLGGEHPADRSSPGTSMRRKHGLTQLQNDIERAMTVDDTASDSRTAAQYWRSNT
ncbi:hypothetical protein P175DRAFT_0516082 [Aspergillus ochraceoroseus IBT 24754]|uniref:Rhodopsin domain-containing protein n=1 Tax=Aspergillus ochraceoroseus IBT 24754 TaxID=1392256 RepID=A0A2T5M0P4_9EURO|nr:uncharacterized protein P175DRAFT_0516082 [Aspergillus ochraceoroseus IBT 24754]PTU22107.1 hypothetical protein P175DRAFT_0516082 [Aspergillus ochraceoroseus IBT 24754]